MNTTTNVAWEQFCFIRGTPSFDGIWLSKSPPKNNTFPPRIADADINGKPLKEIVERFGVVQSKDTTVLHLLLSDELLGNGDDSDVSVQPAHYHFNYVYLHTSYPYFALYGQVQLTLMPVVYTPFFVRDF